jgi:hypothetical protein
MDGNIGMRSPWGSSMRFVPRSLFMDFKLLTSLLRFKFRYLNLGRNRSRKPEVICVSTVTMTILDGGDDELLRLWALIAELSEELNQNRALAVSLYSQASNVKVCYYHFDIERLGKLGSFLIQSM